MITLLNETYITNDRSIKEYVGLTTDTKPSGELNGSTYYEMDSSKKYWYDESAGEWKEEIAH